VAALLGDPFAGAHVGRLTELHDLGPWGQSLLAAESVAEACVLAVANVSSIHQGSDIRFVVEGGTARIIFRFVDRFEFDPRQFILGSLAVLRKVPLLAGEPAAIRVRLTASRTHGSTALEECFGPKIETGCDYDAIEFDRDLLDLSLKTPGNRPSNVTESLASTIEAAKMLSERLSDGHKLGLQTIAKSLGMSVRTLQRRLKFCGVDFEELLDDTRRNEAIRLICEGVHSMTDIALRLGYSDSAHFTRAFKRWTGVAPSRFRTDRI
jgi:AraC-like DNA-binding protein